MGSFQGPNKIRTPLQMKRDSVTESFSLQLAQLLSMPRRPGYDIEETADFKMLVIKAKENGASVPTLMEAEPDLKWPSKGTISGWIHNYKLGIPPRTKKRSSSDKSPVKLAEDVDRVFQPSVEVENEKTTIVESLLSLYTPVRSPCTILEGTYCI